jgi:predicted transcriptional regulator YdeE
MQNQKTEAFQVIGISIRTTNKEAATMSSIGNLWGKFLSENLMSQIPNKTTYDIYCLYTDYESDFTGEFTVILGCKVNSLDDIPKGFVGKTIPAAEYQNFTAKGKMPACVYGTWQEIWTAKIDRKYSTDFEIYGEKSQNPENAEVEIFIALK